MYYEPVPMVRLVTSRRRYRGVALIGVALADVLDAGAALIDGEVSCGRGAQCADSVDIVGFADIAASGWSMSRSGSRYAEMAEVFGVYSGARYIGTGSGCSCTVSEVELVILVDEVVWVGPCQLQKSTRPAKECLENNTR
jgi:hypothetical protein